MVVSLLLIFSMKGDAYITSKQLFSMKMGLLNAGSEAFGAGRPVRDTFP